MSRVYHLILQCFQSDERLCVTQTPGSKGELTYCAAARIGMCYPQGKRWWVRLHEKGGKQHEMPCHHLLETYIDAYVTAAGIGAEKKG